MIGEAPAGAAPSQVRPLNGETGADSASAVERIPFDTLESDSPAEDAATDTHDAHQVESPTATSIETDAALPTVGGAVVLANSVDSAPSPPVGARNPRLIQIGALLIVACCALLPVVTSGLVSSFARGGSVIGVVGALLWLAMLATGAVLIDRGMSRS